MKLFRTALAAVAIALASAGLVWADNVWLWSTTPSNNATADPGINWQEGQLPGTVNNSARGMMAAIAKFLGDTSPAVVTGGTGAAYTYTAPSGFTSYPTVFRVTVALHAANTVQSPTIAFNGLSALTIRRGDGSTLAIGELNISVKYDLICFSASTACHVVNYAKPASILVASGSASSVATLDLTLPAGFKSFKIILSNLSPASAGANLIMRVSTDNGSTYASGAGNYRAATFFVDEAAASGASSTAGATSIDRLTAALASAGRSHVIVEINDYDLTVVPKPILFRSAYIVDATNVYETRSGMGVYTAANSALTNVRFLMSSGNISTVEYQVYGELG